MAKLKSVPKQIPAAEHIEFVILSKGGVFGHPNTVDLGAAVLSTQTLSKLLYDIVLDLPANNAELTALASAVMIQAQLLASALHGLPNTDDDEVVQKIVDAAFARDAIELANWHKR